MCAWGCIGVRCVVGMCVLVCLQVITMEFVRMKWCVCAGAGWG